MHFLDETITSIIVDWVIKSFCVHFKLKENTHFAEVSLFPQKYYGKLDIFLNKWKLYRWFVFHPLNFKVYAWRFRESADMRILFNWLSFLFARQGKLMDSMGRTCLERCFLASKIICVPPQLLIRPVAIQLLPFSISFTTEELWTL